MIPFLILGVASLGFGITMATVVGGLVTSGDVSPPIPRKVFHAAVFAGAVPAQLLLGFWGVVTYGTGISLLLFSSYQLRPSLPFWRGLTRADKELPGPAGSILIPFLSTGFGGLSSILLLGEFAIVGYLVCGFGDAAGELVGRKWGKHRYRSPFSDPEAGPRSLEGSIGVFLFGALAAAVALSLLGSTLPELLVVALACGGVGSLAEGLSGPRTDNFWVQVIPSLAAWWLIG